MVLGFFFVTRIEKGKMTKLLKKMNIRRVKSGFKHWFEPSLLSNHLFTSQTPSRSPVQELTLQRLQGTRSRITGKSSLLLTVSYSSASQFFAIVSHTLAPGLLLSEPKGVWGGKRQLGAGWGQEKLLVLKITRG